MEKYLDQQTCADFIVSGTDYFNYNLNYDQNDEGYISEDDIRQIRENTSQTISGCAYTLAGEDPVGWMPEEALRTDLSHYDSEDEIESDLATYDRKDDLLGADAQIEGLDTALFEKLTVVRGDLDPLFEEDSNAIAVVIHTDDYGNVDDLEYYPSLGATQKITYGNKDVAYTVCAYVTVPYAMSYRYKTIGYGFVLPADRLKSDSGQTLLPLFYLFDTDDSAAEQTAESYLAGLTSEDESGLMYESKASVRAEFENFQRMFLILGGVLCAIIWLVGILNYFNAIMTGILSRRREFAVLQAVGMTNRQLRKMLVYEGIFYALSAAVAALVIAIAFNPMICSLLENMFWFFSADFTIVPVLAVIPVFALLG